VLAFDVGDRDSFERLGDWLEESARFGLGRGAVVVVGIRVQGFRVLGC